MFKLEVHHFAHKLTWISQILYDNLRMLLIRRLFEVSETSCILVFSEITPTGSHFPNLVFIFVLAAILVPMKKCHETLELRLEQSNVSNHIQK